MSKGPTRLSDYERHVLWLISLGRFNQPGNERHPVALSLQQEGLIAWTERGFELTARGMVAMEGRS